MQKNVLLLFIFFCFASLGFPATLGLGLSNVDGFEMSVGADGLEIGLGYPRLKLQTSAGFLGIYNLESDAAVNMESPATDSHLVVSFGGRFGSINPCVGVGVELMEPAEVATNVSEVGRFFVRARCTFRLHRIDLEVMWDRYVYSMLQTDEGYVFNYFKINDSPVSGNRVTFTIHLSFPFNRGSVVLGLGYVFKAGWIRSIEQVGYSIDRFLLSFTVFRDF
ncbi:MAG: hypothetical protein DRP27_03265 [Thermotogae bacterium]|nr:MAG: hypothetical protein DRP27_03265 [Thermotogota bacterium]